MASATTFADLPGSLPTLSPEHTPTMPTDIQPPELWATKLKQQLLLISPYTEIEDIPSSVTIDESILNAPRRRAADPAAANLANEIAQLMYSSNKDLGSLFPIIQYEKDLVRLRKSVILQRKRAIEENTKLKDQFRWEPRIIKQGAWNPVIDPLSFGGAPSLPMPVEIADPESLASFFQHLALGGDVSKTSTVYGDEAVEIEEPYYNIASLEFEKGVVYSDNRLDLCKMVLGPNNIGALMESLKTNAFITHFLLGNNIIGPHGAKCIADFLKEYPNRMDTWYLAGNCIDTASFGLLVDEWVKSTSVTNIWLKRNPLGPNAANDIFRLITQTANLRTLDLDQTELGDAGVAELFTALTEHDKPVALRHIYLNAVGIGSKAAAAIAKYLATSHCALDSLYPSNNPLGNEGVANLAIGLKKNKSLSRLTLASVGMSDDGAITLCDALENHPKLVTLDIGQSYATEDLGCRYNWITDRSAFAVHNLVSYCPKLAYLNVTYTAMTHLGLSVILESAILSSTLLYYRASTVWPQATGRAATHAGLRHSKLTETANTSILKNIQRTYGPDTTLSDFMNEHKRWLVNDKTDVRKIDSVYRNRDAGLARRGLKKLDKWWDEDDETLKAVMGAVGPVCTRLKQKVTVDGTVGPVCTKKKQSAVVT